MAKPKIEDGEVRNEPVPKSQEPDPGDTDSEDQRQPDPARVAAEDDDGEP